MTYACWQEHILLKYNAPKRHMIDSPRRPLRLEKEATICYFKQKQVHLCESHSNIAFIYFFEMLFSKASVAFYCFFDLFPGVVPCSSWGVFLKWKKKACFVLQTRIHLGMLNRTGCEHRELFKVQSRRSLPVVWVVSPIPVAQFINRYRVWFWSFKMCCCILKCFCLTAGCSL